MDRDEFDQILNKQASGVPVAAQASGSAPSGGLPGLDAEVGKEITLAGVARDAMLGAVVRLDSGGTVYVGGLLEWPEPLSGQRVSVRGVLQRRHLAPQPTVGADGGVSHGAAGTSLILDGASWSAAS